MKIYGINSCKPQTFGNSELKIDVVNSEFAEEKKDKSNNKKILLGLSGLAVLTIAGIMYARHGRLKNIDVSDIKPSKPSSEAAGEAGQLHPTGTSPKGTDDISDITPKPVDLSENASPKGSDTPDLTPKPADSAPKGTKPEETPTNPIEEVPASALNDAADDVAEIPLPRPVIEAETAAPKNSGVKIEEQVFGADDLLAQSQAKRDAMLKLKEENPEEYARLKAERAKAKKEAKAAAKAEELEANTRYHEVFNGEPVKIVTERHGKGTALETFVERTYSEKDGKLMLKVQTPVHFGKKVRTMYTDNTKISMSIKNGTEITQKFYLKNEDGKYELVQRIITNQEDCFTKTVTRLEDGNTKIEVVDGNTHLTTVTIRDKKGNILSENVYRTFPPEESPKVMVLADWYKSYLDLCEKFGECERPCGMPGGAWDHYIELQLKASDPEGYEAYLRLRKYRARYDERAALLEALSNGKISLEGICELKPSEKLEELSSRLRTLREEEDGLAGEFERLSQEEERARQLAIEQQQETEQYVPQPLVIYA
ncbi:MAG: hypothetical protein ACI37Q_07520 [Candidatus Gastranaerophilaceae bacterium]